MTATEVLDLRRPPPITVVALDRANDFEAVHEPGGVVIATGSVGDVAGSHAQPWIERATMTLTDGPCADRRVVAVGSIRDALDEISERISHWPKAAQVCDDVLRAFDGTATALTGITTESLAYSTLQSGPEFARWRNGRRPAVAHDIEPVRVEREGAMLHIRFCRPGRHNAFSNQVRGALLEALDIAERDHTLTVVELSGEGQSFCSGGDLSEFGLFSDPASAHLVRMRHSPALVLDALTGRLADGCRALIHGHVLGSGMEMAAFCGRVMAHPDTVIGLPELSLGLIPGAGGTVSITRRIGRWRTAYLVLSGRTIDAETAMTWGLVDAIAC